MLAGSCHKIARALTFQSPVCACLESLHNRNHTSETISINACLRARHYTFTLSNRNPIGDQLAKMKPNLMYAQEATGLTLQDDDSEGLV